MQEFSHGELSLGQIFEMYMEHHARVHCIRWRDSERFFRNYLSHLAHVPCHQLKRFDIQQLHTRIVRSGKKTTANRVVQLLRSVYNKAREWDLISCPNPATGIKLSKLKSRERFLGEEEISRFYVALQTLRYETTRDFLLMCLLTGARSRANVAAMRWDQVNLERGIWYMPDTKNGTSHTLPLVKHAILILRRRHRKAQSEWVFPSSRSRTGHITKPERAWGELLQRAGLDDLRIHDLRRTLASYEAMTGANLSVIARTLNHKDLKSVAVYARLQLDPVRDAMETATQAMMRNGVVYT